LRMEAMDGLGVITVRGIEEMGKSCLKS
jgi:hypothetical protein